MLIDEAWLRRMKKFDEAIRRFKERNSPRSITDGSTQPKSSNEKHTN